MDNTEKKPCPVCQKPISKGYLKRHISNMHPDSMEISVEEPIITADEWVLMMESSDDLVSTVNSTFIYMAESKNFNGINNRSSLESDQREQDDRTNNPTKQNRRSVSGDKPNRSEENPRRKRTQPEAAIQKKFEKKLDGKHQNTPVGIIDILTNTEIIEIKCWSNWKSAIGQLFAYGYYYPNHMKRIHLFGQAPDEKLQQAIFAICASLRIGVSIEPYHPEK